MVNISLYCLLNNKWTENEDRVFEYVKILRTRLLITKLPPRLLSHTFVILTLLVAQACYEEESVPVLSTFVMQE